MFPEIYITYIHLYSVAILFNSDWFLLIFIFVLIWINPLVLKALLQLFRLTFLWTEKPKMGRLFSELPLWCFMMFHVFESLLKWQPQQPSTPKKTHQSHRPLSSAASSNLRRCIKHFILKSAPCNQRDQLFWQERTSLTGRPETRFFFPNYFLVATIPSWKGKEICKPPPHGHVCRQGGVVRPSPHGVCLLVSWTKKNTCIKRKINQTSQNATSKMCVLGHEDLIIKTSQLKVSICEHNTHVR